MTAQTMVEPTFATLLAARWEGTARKIAELGEAIPEESFNTVNVPGLRSCGDVIRHVAFWNRYVANSLAGEPADDSGNELSASEYPDKRSMLKELEHSAQDAASMLRKQQVELTRQTGELMVSFIEHTSEHYGQLVVYSRMLGIVPPASRG